MANPNSKVLVIDTVITLAASEKAEIRASQCRKLLDAVLDICHKFLMTPEIEEEWDKHRSHYSFKWLTTMNDKGKVITANITHDDSLGGQISRLLNGKDEYNAVMKDVLLVDGALNADKIVISLDKKAQGHFQRISNAIEQLKPVMWVNLSDDFDGVIKWLEDGAPLKNEYQLGYNKEET